MMNRVHYKLPRGTAASIVEMKSKWHVMPNRKGFHMPDTESSRKAPRLRSRTCVEALCIRSKERWAEVCALGKMGSKQEGEAACRDPQRPGRGEVCRNSRDAAIQDTHEDLRSRCCLGHWASACVLHHPLAYTNSVFLTGAFLCAARHFRNHWTPELFPADLFLS